ncbi:MAG TPA: DUF695 domain-containing protein [Telluria sp.]|jgi:hypothetical protein
MSELLAADRPINPGEDRPTAWWSYIAEYEEGPGSILLDLRLRVIAPVENYRHVVVTGPSYTSTRCDAFPDTEEFGRVSALSDAVCAAIAAKTPSIFAGRFTCHFEQLSYVYVQDPTGLAEVIAGVYATLCPAGKTYTNIKEDASWAAYLDFLFPNAATRQFYGVLLDCG